MTDESSFAYSRERSLKIFEEHFALRRCFGTPISCMYASLTLYTNLAEIWHRPLHLRAHSVTYFTDLTSH